MKSIKIIFTLFLLSFGLTGCYTQLKYSQGVNRITDEKPVGGYAWDGSSSQKAQPQQADSIYIAKTKHAKADPNRSATYDDQSYYGDDNYEDAYTDDYIPVYYKDYAMQSKWDACGCNPYRSYSFYNDPFYNGWYSFNSYYGYPWYAGSFYGYRYRPWRGFWWPHRPGFALSFSWYWGNGFYYDPFFYDPYYYSYYGYGPSFAVIYSNYYYYHHNNGYYGDTNVSRTNRRYGPRTIGTSRVTGRSRSDADVSRRYKDRSQVRSRSNTVTRHRGTVQRNRSATHTRSRGTVSRSRGTGTVKSSGTRSRSSGNSRSRGTVQRSRSGHSSNNNGNVKRRRGGNNHSSLYVPRSVSRSRAEIQSAVKKRMELESTLRNRRAVVPAGPQNRSRSSVFGRVGNFFNNSLKKWSRSINRSSSSNNSSSHRSAVRSRTSSSSHHSVSRSRSSHSSSSGSRSRSSSGNNSSSRSRSRGNNN